MPRKLYPQSELLPLFPSDLSQSAALRLLQAWRYGTSTVNSRGVEYNYAPCLSEDLHFILVKNKVYYTGRGMQTIRRLLKDRYPDGTRKNHIHTR